MLDNLIYFCVTLFIPLIDTIQTIDEPYNQTEFKVWIDKMEIQELPLTSVINITTPNINVYPALYFIHEKLPNSNMENDLLTLRNHLRYVNNGLSKGGILSYIRGFSYVSKPPDMTDISYGALKSYVEHKLRDLTKNYADQMIFMIFIIYTNYDYIMPPPMSELCDDESLFVRIWNYNISGRPYNIGDEMIYTILYQLGCGGFSCQSPRGSINCDNELYEKTFHQHDEHILTCIRNLVSTDIKCANQIPVDVALSVCGNGLLEGKEYCDCLDIVNCPIDCNPVSCIKQELETDIFSTYIILIISVVIVAGIVLFACLFILIYYNRALNKKSSASNSSTSGISSVISPLKMRSARSSKKKSKQLIDPGFRASKSKILILEPKIDLSIKEITSGPPKGPIPPPITPLDFGMVSQSFTMTKLGTEKTKTLPESITKSTRSTRKKSSTDLIHVSKGELKISSKFTGAKSKIPGGFIKKPPKNSNEKK